MKDKRGFPSDKILMALLILFFSLIVIAGVVATMYRFKHPELTETQLAIWSFKTLWWAYFSAVGIFVVNFISKFK